MRLPYCAALLGMWASRPHIDVSSVSSVDWFLPRNTRILANTRSGGLLSFQPQDSQNPSMSVLKVMASWAQMSPQALQPQQSTLYVMLIIGDKLAC